MLKLPCETRFCNKNEVMETFVCAPFAKWEATQNEGVKTKVVHVHSLLNSHQFWDGVGDAYHVMMLVMLALQQLDTRLPNIGKVWMAWWTVQPSLNDPQELDNNIVKPIMLWLYGLDLIALCIA